MSPNRSRLPRGFRYGLVLAVLLVTAPGFLQSRRQGGGSESLLSEVMWRVRGAALDSVAEAQLYEKAARGLVRELGDPYARLFSPEEVASFTRNSIGDSYGGLGMEIAEQGEWVVVLRVFANTPADHGGVVAGDRIAAIGGEPARGLGVEEVSNRLTGPAGTDIEVTFARAGASVPIRGTFTRANVHVPAVPFALLLEPGIGYVPLQRFSASATDELRDAVRDLARRGADRFVLDLRGNGGGRLEQAIAVAGTFLPAGSEVSRIRYRSRPQEVYVTERPPLLPDAPLVVLTDEGSASASEIVAGALQDHDRALLVGSVSFGKGLVQDMYRLQGDWALKLTTGEWFTPSGRSIEKPLQGEDTTSAPGAVAFTTEAGRPVEGGGGIRPDSLVEGQALSEPEQALARSLAPSSQVVGAAILDVALELKPTLRPDFEVTAEWRDRVYRELAEDGVEVDRLQYDAGADLIERLLEYRAALIAFGEQAAFERQVASDRALQTALQVLRQAPTTATLLGLRESAAIRG